MRLIKSPLSSDLKRCMRSYFRTSFFFNPLSEIIDKLKISHEKFEDPDFGPSSTDEFGAISLYGSGTPNPAGKRKLLIISFFNDSLSYFFNAIIMHNKLLFYFLLFITVIIIMISYLIFISRKRHQSTTSNHFDFYIIASLSSEIPFIYYLNPLYLKVNKVWYKILFSIFLFLIVMELLILIICKLLEESRDIERY